MVSGGMCENDLEGSMKKYDAYMGFYCYNTEKEVVQRAAQILGVSASSFIRSAVLAQALPMEDCRKVVLNKRKEMK